MDERTITRLCKLNTDFYTANHYSFSQSRKSPWAGWTRVLARFDAPPQTVLDVACGNMRLKAFLDDQGAYGLRYYGVDACSDIVPQMPHASFQRLDLMDALRSGLLEDAISVPPCDFTACFGFMHHVPTPDLRQRLIDALAAKTAPGGTLALSFWQFANVPALHDKAVRTTQRGCAELGLRLDEGDYLLGWGAAEGAYRYCHSFADDEISALAAHVQSRAHLIDRFAADGRTGALNAYLVFRVP